ncbi:MAG: hypothetical protein IKH54_03905 [Bacilli bacterium]|nr:hypothetical protein [Bacilli bacterium]
MKRRNKLKLNKRIVAALAVLLAVGFAYISSAVNIGGVFTLFKSTWDIHFDNVQVTEGSVSANPPSFNSNNPELTLAVQFTNPGDYYEFTIDAVNNGDIDGMLDTFSDLGLTEEQLAYLKYTITYADGESLAQYQELNAGDTCTFKIRIEFRDDIPAEDLPQGGASLSLGFDVSYVRADSNRIRRRAENTLYNVLKEEAESGGLAKKYTGQHQDSIDASKSTKDIYHWYVINTSQGTEAKNKNNVIFANHCWQMIRTTDTGGVKLIYNGEVDNNQCLNTRGTHVGYNTYAQKKLDYNYWYGTSYSYDSANEEFTLEGTTTQLTWSDSTYEQLVGKYTCLSTASPSDTCSPIYYINDYSTETQANVIPIEPRKHYSLVGDTVFNYDATSSPSINGYKFGKQYKRTVSISWYHTTYLDVPGEIYLNNSSFNNNYYFANSVTYDSNTKKYTLVDPYLFTGEDYSVLSGKYTLFNNSPTYSSKFLYHVGGKKGESIYTKLYKETPVADIKGNYFGTTITNNGNGTYTLNNAINVLSNEWFNNYENYEKTFTCENGSTTCENPKFITNTNIYSYEEIDANEEIVIGKNKNGLNLTNTITIKKYELILNKEDYEDYKYTCGNDSSICTDNNLKYILEVNDDGFEYVGNYYFANSVTYDGTNYHLNNYISAIDNYTDISNFKNNHYFCTNLGDTTCSKVNYFYYIDPTPQSNLISFITVDDGATNINTIFSHMLENNINNSAIKNVLEYWYKNNLYEYNDYIEDTIYCNDRSFSDTGGWLNNGTVTDYLRYNNYSTSNSFNCTNITDRFSVNNNSAKTNYPVGMITKPEVTLSGYKELFKTGMAYWTLSPSHLETSYTYNFAISNTGNPVSKQVISTSGIRPTISLKSTTFYTSGNGSMESPYVIYTE